VIAAKTTVPVLGVPMPSKYLHGFGIAALDRADAQGFRSRLLRSVKRARPTQDSLPSAMLAQSDAKLAKRLAQFRASQAEAVKTPSCRVTRASSRFHLSRQSRAPIGSDSGCVAILRRGGWSLFQPRRSMDWRGRVPTRAVARNLRGQGPSRGPSRHRSYRDIGQWIVGRANVPGAAIQTRSGFWPGPLTLVLWQAPGVADSAHRGQHTIGLRIPGLGCFATPREFGRRMCSSQPVWPHQPDDGGARADDSGSEVDLILDGGTCEIGIESTIVVFRAGGPCCFAPAESTQGYRGDARCRAWRSAIQMPRVRPDARGALRAPATASTRRIGPVGTKRTGRYRMAEACCPSVRARR